MILNNIKIKVTDGLEKLKERAILESGIKNPKHFEILKKSIDARNKNDIYYIYAVEIDEDKKIVEVENKKIKSTPKYNPIVIGFGPCGLFSALILARSGLCPIVLERGESVDNRKNTVNIFFETGKLNTSSNVQFGEGGAGAFSDGKLNTQIKNPKAKEVLKIFTDFGAPSEIIYENKPHIGSDKLPLVVKNMREEIIALGGKVYFNCVAEDFITVDDYLLVKTNQGEFKSQDVILAIGHSSRDTIYKLSEKGIMMESKNFAVGLRIEHLQKDINKTQYGKFYNILPPADYKLTYNGKRSAYTFCMCPGGYVMPATSEENCVVTNGMSNFARDGENANSALIAEVRKEDFETSSPLSGIEYQRKLEKMAFKLGGGNYLAPCQMVDDFLKNRITKDFGSIKPTYSRGVTPSNLNEILPLEIATTLKDAIYDMDRRLNGFNRKDAVLTGVETRTSSPVRITRGEDMRSIGNRYLYPVGEGAGYAGGIMSSALDGMKVAEKIIEKYL